MSNDEWELFILSKVWCLNYASEDVINFSCVVYGVKLTITYEKLSSLEIKHDKRASILVGG